MNKQDAKVYKALAEAGFEIGKEIPDPEADRIVKALTDKTAMELDDIITLFSEDTPTETQKIREEINELLK